MMKIGLSILMCCCLAFSGCEEQRYSRIAGKVADESLKEVTLYKTVDGSIQSYATTQVGPDGTYGFMFVPEQEGFYAVGTERVHFPVWLKAGDAVGLNIEGVIGRLHGKNTPENEMLYQWENLADSVRIKSILFEKVRSNYKDFFPVFPDFVSKAQDFQKKVKTGNSKFDEILKKKIGYDVDFYAIMFLQTPRSVHPQREDWPEYYSQILSDEKFVNDEVLQFPDGYRMLSSYASFYFRFHPVQINGTKEFLENSLRAIKNDRLKGELVINNFSRSLKSYDAFLEMQDQFGRYFVTPSLKARAEALGARVYDTKPGMVAADFTYPDVKGKEISLSDFKGKVVVVDVWATWCGPCRQELPSLKKLEKELHGKDVVFMGVSVDEEKNKQKWLDFVKKEQLQGVQLFASGWSKIAKDYQIKAIPRFMVFDKEGKIVSVDAPRPSNPALKEMIEKELKK